MLMSVTSTRRDLLLLVLLGRRCTMTLLLNWDLLVWNVLLLLELLWRDTRCGGLLELLLLVVLLLRRWRMTLTKPLLLLELETIQEMNIPNQNVHKIWLVVYLLLLMLKLLVGIVLVVMLWWHSWGDPLTLRPLQHGHYDHKGETESHPPPQ